MPPVVLIFILQASIVTQTMLGGHLCIFWLQIFHSVYGMCKNYDNWLAVDKVIAK